MSGELKRSYQSSVTVYATVRDTQAEVWRPGALVFEAFGTFGRAMPDYDIAKTESGDSGQYVGDFPADIASGTYLVLFYEQLGSAPADDDAPIGYDYGQWTGTRWLREIDLVSGPGNALVTVTIRTSDQVPVEGVQVWVNDDNDSTVSIVPVRTTDSNGEVSFYLDLNRTYYVFCEHSAYQFAAATVAPATGTLAFVLDIASLPSSGTEKKTCAELISRVLDLVGRKHTTSNLDLASIVLDALNEAQRRIAQRIPAALDLEVQDETTFVVATNDYTLDLTQLDPKLDHLHRLFLLNGLESMEVAFKTRDWFDRNFPSITALTAGFPSYWTRRGNTVVFSCPWSSTYSGLHLRLDYEKKPTRFLSTTSTATSDFEDADEGLILWGKVKALQAIARGSAELLQLAADTERQWREWLIDYEAQIDLETEQNLDDHPEPILYEDYSL
jgi:hypothetical protein